MIECVMWPGTMEVGCGSLAPQAQQLQQARGIDPFISSTLRQRHKVGTFLSEKHSRPGSEVGTPIVHEIAGHHPEGMGEGSEVRSISQRE